MDEDGVKLDIIGAGEFQLEWRVDAGVPGFERRDGVSGIQASQSLLSSLLQVLDLL